MFEAARWAASCNNSQPWRFIVAKKENPKEYAKALSCFNENNQKWASTAPVIGFVGAYQLMSSDKKVEHIFMIQVWQCRNLRFKRSSIIYIYIRPGVLLDEIKIQYEVPDDVDIIYWFCSRISGEADILPEPYNERELQERVRNPIEDFVFTNSFNKDK